MFTKKNPDIEHAKHILADARPEQVFYVFNGTVVHNIYELKNLLPQLTDEQFGHHVSNGRNDFANWVRDVLGDETLSQQMTGKTSREKLAQVLEKRIKNLEDHIYEKHLTDIEERMKQKDPHPHKNTAHEKQHVEKVIADVPHPDEDDEEDEEPEEQAIPPPPVKKTVTISPEVISGEKEIEDQTLHDEVEYRPEGSQDTLKNPPKPGIKVRYSFPPVRSSQRRMPETPLEHLRAVLNFDLLSFLVGVLIGLLFGFIF